MSLSALMTLLWSWVEEILVVVLWTSLDSLMLILVLLCVYVWLKYLGMVMVWDARLVDAEPYCSVSGRIGAGLSSFRYSSRDAAS